MKLTETESTRLPWRLLLAASLLSMGCAEKEEGEDDDLDIYENTPGEGEGEGEGEATCDGTWSIITGQVTGPYTDDPAPEATVYAWHASTGDEYSTTTDDDGYFELTVEPSEEMYIEAYTWEGCWSYSFELTALECDTQTFDIHVEECDVADKPNLYLYPESPTDTRVRLELDRRQNVVASIPEYRPTGWHGIAHTDGTWTEHGQRVRDPFLFYEVSLAGWQARTLQRDAGWCIPFGGVAAVFAMADILGEYGFDARERDDFVDAWVHDLPPAESYAVYPQVEVDHMAGLDIRPWLPVDRLWLVVDDGAGCAPRHLPEVEPFDRDGAHGVEWGVVLGDLVR
jgi:hypothetical protein